MLYEVVNRKFRVCALLVDRDFQLSCLAWDFLREQNATNPGHVRGMKALFHRYAEGGRTTLTTDLFHHASAEHDIMEFIKGQLRIFCFTEGNTILLTHGALKKSQKADPQQVGIAVSMRDKYNEWKGKP